MRLITNDFPSTYDRPAQGANGHSAAFVRELELNPNRSLGEWRATRWSAIINGLARGSGLDDADFERFLAAFRLVHSGAANFVQVHRLSPAVRREIEQIAAKLPSLVADRHDRDRWTRSELLDELGWRDTFALRRTHRFPIGAHVQRNLATEQALRQALRDVTGGYIGLIGAPGSGKSTLLQSAIGAAPDSIVIRYLAFVPGEAQGLGRGEAEDFLDDINTQLKSSGLVTSQFREANLSEKRQRFEGLLAAAGTRFNEKRTRTLVVIDGLDHIPREERYAHSMLGELPQPSAVPDGVIIMLGSQRLDLSEMRPTVQRQAQLSGRLIEMAPLSRDAVARMAELVGLSSDVCREELYDLSRGHPLATRYLIEALRGAGEPRRASILAGEMSFEGDIEVVYAGAWADLEGDEEARDVINFVARAEAPIRPELLAAATSPAVVDRVFSSTRHLLGISRTGWSTFHNSFRLFVLSRPRLRYGLPDPDYGRGIYRRLAELAKTHSEAGIQRWLELRYCARAGDHERVLELAQASLFREQLAEGRPISDLMSDMKFAFVAAREAGNHLDVFRILLIQDEIERRATSLEYATSVVEAFVAVNDLEAAEAYVDTHQTAGYVVVDALLAAGETDRARALFDRLEPVARLAGGSPDAGNRMQELRDWALRVHAFRDADQIKVAVGLLSTPTQSMPDGDGSALSRRLRLQIARSVGTKATAVDPEELLRDLELDEDLLPVILADMTLVASRKKPERVLPLLRRVVQHERFNGLSVKQRRALASVALDFEVDDVAQNIFAELPFPTVRVWDGTVDQDLPSNTLEDVIKHAELATRLGQPLKEVLHSQRALLRPLQFHAETAGVLLARARTPGALATGDVERATMVALTYLGQAQPEGAGEFYAATQLARAAPVLARALLKAAERCGRDELDRAVATFDLMGSRTGLSLELRKTVAVFLYRATGDIEGPRERLWTLAESVQERSPEQQVELLGELATSFASVGDDDSARKLLAGIHRETLGYSLPPKKDGQYETWLELLKRANEADPASRARRISEIMRVITGMEQTEGKAAAHRLAPQVLTKAVLVDAATGMLVASALASRSLIAWDILVDALLLGLLRRRPDLAKICGIIWSSLALPFYVEPYYSTSRTGEFIDAVLNAADVADFETVVAILRDAISSESRTGVRALLARRLQQEAEHRGLGQISLAEFGQRWRQEAPVSNKTNSPDAYDSVSSLAELDAKAREAEEPDWNFARTFSRLVPEADFDDARRMFASWPTLQTDARARFTLLDRALVEEDTAFATELAQGYRSYIAERGGWSGWTGAANRN